MTTKTTHTSGSDGARRPAPLIAWVLGSSLIWAAVVVVIGDSGWPLVVWALTTFAPLAWDRTRKAAR